jgi:hypothetical protein
MTDEIVEGAKAVQESAKAAGKAIDGLRETGGFFNRVFGDLIEDGIGVVADRVKFYRLERAVLLAEKTEERLKDRGIEVTVSVPPKLAIPLIESATLEDNDDLHTLWSNLLANAMDPSVSHKVTHIHVSILKEMEPLDVRILSIIANEKLSRFPDEPFNEVHFERAKIADDLKISTDTIDLSLLNLMRLGCVTPGVVSGAASIGGHKLSSYKGTELIHLSPLGLSLVLAVQ